MRARRRDPAAPAPSPAAARGLALTLVSRREYTAHEVLTKLLLRGCTPEVADATVASLVADGAINDRRAGAAHIRTASAIKGRGRYRIERELVARGLAKDLVRDLLRDVTAESETAAIRRFVAAKRLPSRPDPASRRRVFQQLLRRGFSADAIGKVLRRDDSHDTDETNDTSD
jgi:SOS response regulatory protein OraA/RecX